MKKKFSKFIFLVSYLLSPKQLFAWDDDQGDVATIKSLEGLFSNVIGVAISLIGLTTFIMIIIGGIKYLTSGGDPKNTEAAQTTITQGVIGLVLAIAAYFILTAISSFTGVEGILKFKVGLE